MDIFKSLVQYTKDLNVLYVEDNDLLIRTTTVLFENFFNHIDVAEDGQIGLNKFLAYKQETGKYYDLVITDINMPHLNGIDMSKQILDENPNQPIIITTAHNEIEYLTQAIELGVSGFVTKPIKNLQLIKVLHKTSRSICDHNFVISHIETVEKMNAKLESKNAKLEQSLRVLDTVMHKKQMSKPKVAEKPHTQSEDLNQKHMEEQVQDMIENDLEELTEILTEIDVKIIETIKGIDDVSEETVLHFIDLFSKYSAILRFYTFFDDLGHAMSNFSNTMKEYPLPENKESVKNIFMILESFVFMLSKWHDDIANSDNHINHFDESIISDMNMIINMWTEKENDTEEADVDNIFDF